MVVIFNHTRMNLSKLHLLNDREKIILAPVYRRNKKVDGHFWVLVSGIWALAFRFPVQATI